MMAKTAAEEATLKDVDRRTAKLVVTGPGTIPLDDQGRCSRKRFQKV
jgi:hypothetical protein